MSSDSRRTAELLEHLANQRYQNVSQRMQDRCLRLEYVKAKYDPSPDYSQTARQELVPILNRYFQRIIGSLEMSNNGDTVYTGGPGISFALLEISGAAWWAGGPKEGDILPPEELVEKWRNRMMQEYANDRALGPSLLCGPTGLLVVSILRKKAIMQRLMPGRTANNANTTTAPPTGGGEEYAALEQSLIQDFKTCMDIPFTLDKNPDVPNEWLYGRAGFLHGLLLLRQRLQFWNNRSSANSLPTGLSVVNASGILNSRIEACYQAIIASGLQYAKQVNQRDRRFEKPIPIMWNWYGDDYLGAAHGVCGILHQLLNAVHQCYKPGGGATGIFQQPQSLLDMIMKSMDWLIQECRMGVYGRGQGNWTSATRVDKWQGNFPSCLGEEEASLVHFCHGAPGFVMLFAFAARLLAYFAKKCPEFAAQATYFATKAQVYRAVAESLGELVYEYGVLKKGPGLCHGTAGNGFCFLSLFRLHNARLFPDSQKNGDTISNKWLNRAWEYFQIGYRVESELSNPDHPFSLFEGIAGTALLGVALKDPVNSAFPLYELRWDDEEMREAAMG